MLITTEYFGGTGFCSAYKIKGQALEQEYRYFKTGEVVKADNLPATRGCDLGNASIKSARATVCYGLDIRESLKTDKAEVFIYLTQDRYAHIMSREVYIDFVETFKTADYDSHTKVPKLRLKRETKAMLDWLEQRAKPSA